jgi:phytoene/squalene synthetase
MVCGYRDEARALLSDKICTGLQLANFWQDIVRDSDIPRRYLPAEYMQRFGVAEGQIEGRVFTPEFGAMMRALVDRTREMLREGAPISDSVDDELRVTLDLFRNGGEAILDGIAAQDYDVLRGRPVVTRRKKLALLLGALLGKLSAGHATPTNGAGAT